MSSIVLLVGSLGKTCVAGPHEKRDSASKMLPKKRKRGIDHQADQEATAFVKTLNSKRGTKPSYEEVLRMLE